MSARRVDIIGGGPGGLYAAGLLKTAQPDWTVTVHERMSGSRDTFGFGVSLTSSTMTNLVAADPASAEAIQGVSHSGHGLLLLDGGEAIDLHGARNLAVSRSSLLEVLARHAEAAGVRIRSGAQVGATELDSDVVIAADGVRSATREKLATELGADIRVGRGMYVWCGSDFALDDAIFSPARTEHGLFVAHAYPYAEDRSTFLIEADEASWRAAGLERSDAATADGESDEHTLRYLERAFAADLAGHPLLGNRSRWSRFHTVHLERWSHGNTVLIGDAAHTAHYTLGSGTKLALEDAIALSAALLAEGDTAAAFTAYEQSRRPAVTRFQHLAARSQRWWESYPLRVDQPLAQLAVGFMTRAGNIDLGRFAVDHPDVVAAALGHYARRSVTAVPADITAWALQQPYDDGRESRTASRIVTGSGLGHDAQRIEVVDVDPWGEAGDRGADLAKAATAAGRVIHLHGADDTASVQGRLDLGERIKLQTAATVLVGIPEHAAADALSGLVSGRCDLIHFTR
ncbi:FAD-dependent monooxygenase [Streptomyces sp. NBC_01477]|uniref:FAD-dependent monooxygenase n=1 Tax=Streptomyces sp. NBC_01477 TaxID=2976015 RepID=UPI002E3532D4|nr:FAD-dependent monooxygenase [Streptomyces sp. NBC_01477]